MTRAVTLLVLDVDGVLTDNRVLLLPDGAEARSVNFRDLDAVTAARRAGLQIAILSGEDSPSSRQVADRFAVTQAVWGAKDKLPAMVGLLERLGTTLGATCFVGDSDRDAPVLGAVGIGLAPADATAAAVAAADHVLGVNGGSGVVAAAVTLLDSLGLIPHSLTASDRTT